MNSSQALYRANLSLLTDLYQLTMVYAGWKNGFMAPGREKIAVFDLYFRTNPFKGGFAVSCGLNSILDFIENFRIEQKDCDYLASLKGGDGKALFEPEFLK